MALVNVIRPLSEAPGGELIVRGVERVDGIEAGGEGKVGNTDGDSVSDHWKRRMREEYESLDGKFWDYHQRRHR